RPADGRRAIAVAAGQPRRRGGDEPKPQAVAKEPSTSESGGSTRRGGGIARAMGKLIVRHTSIEHGPSARRSQATTPVVRLVLVLRSRGSSRGTSFFVGDPCSEGRGAVARARGRPAGRSGPGRQAAGDAPRPASSGRP